MFSTTTYIYLSSLLVPGFPWIFLVAYGFLYTPIISYVSARMEGIAGQFVSLPMVQEASFIAASKFFGYHGIGIWYAPIPYHNYGKATVKWREVELTGTSFRSIIKAELVVLPVVLLASLLFSQYIWQLAPIPSEHYPYAQELWHLRALNTLLLQSSTLEGYSPFFEALNLNYALCGFGLGAVTYWGLASPQAADSANLRHHSRPWADHPPRHLSGNHWGVHRQVLFFQKVRGILATVCPGAPGGFFLRHGPHGYARHGLHSDHAVTGQAGLLKH